MSESIELSVILPCKNEEEALEGCLQSIKKVLKENKIKGEIIVSDSSTDSSPEIARKNNVKLIKHNKDGYGNAYLEAFKIAKGKYLFLADADGSYDFREIPVFLKSLREGYDLIIGNRLKGDIDKGAMPWHHRHIGNPLLSWILRLFFKTNIKDAHSGMRAIRKEALESLNLKASGMEFASEMIIKAARSGLKIKELAINYHSRKGESKLRSFSDGWRHLRFMLLYAPKFLFLIPGMLLFTFGILSMALIYFNLLSFLAINLFYHPMFLSSILIIAGYQLIIFALFSESYAMNHLKENSSLMTQICKKINLEKAVISSILLMLAGAIIYLSIFIRWINNGFGELSEAKNSILALTVITIGIQTLFSSFMLSILSIKEK